MSHVLEIATTVGENCAFKKVFFRRYIVKPAEKQIDLLSARQWRNRCDIREQSCLAAMPNVLFKMNKTGNLSYVACINRCGITSSNGRLRVRQTEIQHILQAHAQQGKPF